MNRTVTALLASALATALAPVLSTATVLVPADAATAAGRAGAYSVTVKVSETAPMVHTRIKIKGTVSPAAPGSQVAIQVKYADRKSWKSIGHARVGNSGKYRFKDKVDSVRERRYRVVMPATGHRAAGRATTPKVTVFGWRTLDSIKAVSAPRYGDVDLNGQHYAHSFTIAPYATQAVWNLKRDCTRLEGTFGLDDSSPTDSTATLSLTADGVQKYLASFGLSGAQAVAVDLTGAFRITIAGAQTGNGIPAVGAPRVLCSF
jgi:hypothetical protein